MLGLHRAAAVEEALRAAPPGLPITAVLVSGRPEEFADLARLVPAELLACLRPAFPETAWPDVHIVHDPEGRFAAAVGVPDVGDLTETAVIVRDGRVVTRAEGFGACFAAAGSER